MVVRRVRFALNANVKARYVDKENNNKVGWYLAHIVNREGDRHDVYFPCNGNVVKGLRVDELRPAPSHWPTRHDMQDKEFTYDGDKDIPEGSIWKVRRLANDRVSFVCTRINAPSGCLNQSQFDVGYVMNKVKKEDEEMRERGPFLRASKRLKKVR
jgi:hypothetical protein